MKKNISCREEKYFFFMKIIRETRFGDRIKTIF